jgi:hypothetical protein
MSSVIERQDDVEYLNAIANNPEAVAQLVALIQRNPAAKDQGVSCIQMLERASQSLNGVAPLPIQIAAQCLTFGAKGLSLFAEKAKAHVSDLKSGIWRNADGNNVLHVGVHNRMRKLVGWGVANCQPIVFDQTNKQGFTPRQLALFHKNLIEAQRSSHLSEKSELESQIEERVSIKKKAKVSQNVKLAALNSKLAKCDKNISHFNAIIAMIDMAAPFFSASELEREISVPEPVSVSEPEMFDFTHVTTLEALQIASAKLKADLFNHGSGQVEMSQENAQEFVDAFDILMDFLMLTPRLYSLVNQARQGVA